LIERSRLRQAAGWRGSRSIRDGSHPRWLPLFTQRHLVGSAVRPRMVASACIRRMRPCCSRSSNMRARAKPASRFRT